MEPKSISFSAGAAFLVMYYAAPDAAVQLGAESASETIILSGLLWSALTAVIVPFAAVGKAGINQLIERINGLAPHHLTQVDREDPNAP